MRIGSIRVGHGAVHRPVASVEDDLVDVAPAPVLTRLEGADDRVIGAVEMLGGVLVLGVVATADVAADHAQSQMDPGIADGEAFLAPLRCTRRDLLDLIEMGAGTAHRVTPFSGRVPIASRPSVGAPTPRQRTGNLRDRRVGWPVPEVDSA